MKNTIATIIETANTLDEKGYSNEADRLTKIAQSLSDIPPYTPEICPDCGEPLTDADVIMSPRRGKVNVYRCENPDCIAEFFHVGEKEDELTDGAPSEW